MALAVAGVSALHFALALGLIAVEPSITDETPVVLASWSVLAATLAAGGMALLRVQYATAAHAARTVPWARAIVGSILPVVLVLGELPAALVARGWSTWLPYVAPGLSAVIAASLVAAIADRVLLRALAIRRPPKPRADAPPPFPPPILGIRIGGLLATAALASGVLALGRLASRPGDFDPTAFGMAAATLAVFVVLVALAGFAFGQSPGVDLQAIARQLDAAGQDGAAALARPVVIVGDDQVGELLANLERLRLRLADELRLYEEALERTKAAEATKADFLSAVSHELRTPLGVVSGYAQLLLEGTPEPLTESQKEDVRLIQAGSHQLLELLNDILDVAMIESGELRLAFAPADLGEVITEVVRIHQPLVRGSEVELRAEVAPNLPHVTCDRRRITQILTNLVSNAIKFTESGAISVRAAHDPRSEAVVIRCIDTGVGIAAEELDAIFEEYRQVGSVKRRKKGTGLGLAIARTIAEHHGGSLTVESTPGEGSTFALRLPLEPPERPQAIDVVERATRSRLNEQPSESGAEATVLA